MTHIKQYSIFLLSFIFILILLGNQYNHSRLKLLTWFSLECQTSFPILLKAIALIHETRCVLSTILNVMCLTATLTLSCLIFLFSQYSCLDLSDVTTIFEERDPRNQSLSRIGLKP